MDNFDFAIDKVLANEGGWSDNPKDKGQATNFGITFQLYKSISPGATIEDLRQLSIDTAKKIYRQYFWRAAAFSQIQNMRVATAIFDASVNSGIKTGIIIAQKACNELLKENLLDLDGQLGFNTLRALNNLDVSKLLAEIRNQRTLFYRAIVNQYPSQEIFLNGWLKRSQK